MKGLCDGQSGILGALRCRVSAGTSRLRDTGTLTTLSGSYHYRVGSTKVVKPEETEVLEDDGDDILTLVTCYPFNFVGSAPSRFIVRAHRVLE